MTKPIFMFLAFAALAAAQTIGGNNSPNAPGPTTFKTTSQLVVETVVAKDKNGKAAEGLTAKDFVITEDGVPQTIRFFEFQRLDEIAQAPLPPSISEVAALQKFPKSQISAEQPGTSKYKDHRLLALYFDMTAMPESDQVRALKAA